MPVPDVDYGMSWRGYHPGIQYGNVPLDTTVSAPFYFGGANIRYYKNVDSKRPTPVIGRGNKKNPKLKVVKKF
jgi:hypothetical protein